jgi:hypothetical protein
MKNNQVFIWSLRNSIEAGLTPVILATQEAVIWRILVRGQPRQKVGPDLKKSHTHTHTRSQKITHTAVGVSSGRVPAQQV